MLNKCEKDLSSTDNSALITNGEMCQVPLQVTGGGGGGGGGAGGGGEHCRS